MRITIQKIRFFSKNIPKFSEKSPKKFQNFQETREIGVFPPAQAPAAQLARLRRAEGPVHYRPSCEPMQFRVAARSNFYSSPLGQHWAPESGLERKLRQILAANLVAMPATLPNPPSPKPPSTGPGGAAGPAPARRSTMFLGGRVTGIVTSFAAKICRNFLSRPLSGAQCCPRGEL